MIHYFFDRILDSTSKSTLNFIRGFIFGSANEGFMALGLKLTSTSQSLLILANRI